LATLRGSRRDRGVRRDMEVTPVRSDRDLRLPLSDVTPPPLSPLRAPRGHNSQAQLSRVETAASVQRFSLRSRRSAPYAEVAVQPGSDCLKPPNRLHMSCEFPAAAVKLCACSWASTLKQNERRLCERNTDEHDEYRLLEAMSYRFAMERASERETVETNLAKKAAAQDLEVHFILAPTQDVVSGYIAIDKTSPALSNTALGEEEFCVQPELSLRQIYVEPECRRMGFATVALKLILAKTSIVALPSPSPEAVQLMERVGFRDSRRIYTEGSPELGSPARGINFYRASPLFDQCWEDVIG